MVAEGQLQRLGNAGRREYSCICLPRLSGLKILTGFRLRGKALPLRGVRRELSII